MKFRHWLAMVGILLIASASGAPLIADHYWPVFGIIAGLGILCVSLAALITPTGD